MKYVLILVLLLVASVCQAQIIVSISDQVPPPVKYPPEVYKMTDAEFFKWATKFNQAQSDDWKKRKAEIKEPEYLTGEEEVITTEYNRSYGPSYDYGGYGGYGGGYFARSPYSYGGYGGYGGGYFARLPYGCGLGGCGLRPGYGDNGGSVSGSSVQRKGTYPWRRPNPAYVGPGPLVIVNPYVRPK